MGFHLHWDDDLPAIIYCPLQSSWSWDDVCEAVNSMKKCFPDRSVSGVIVDLNDGLSVPGGTLFERSTLAGATFLLSMAEGYPIPVMVVGADAPARQLFGVLHDMNQRATHHVRFVDSADAARAYLGGLSSAAQPGNA